MIYEEGIEARERFMKDDCDQFKSFEGEIWKPVPVLEYIWRYKVSNFGRVKNKNGKLLSQNINNMGYPRVNLISGKYSGSYLVSRLVAMAFVANPQKLPIVNHKDENPLNNTPENLEWCTYKYNNNYGNILLKNSKGHGGRQVALVKNGEWIRFEAAFLAAEFISKKIGKPDLRNSIANKIRNICRGTRKNSVVEGYVVENV